MMNASEFKSIVMPLSSDLFRLAASILVDRDKAADAVQDCMEALWNHRNALRNAQNQRAYCFTTLRNIACSELRRQPAISPIEMINDDAIDCLTECDTALTDRCKNVSDLIKLLPEPARTLITLSSSDDYSTADLSELTGLSAANVRTILSRTRKYLRNKLLSLEINH